VKISRQQSNPTPNSSVADAAQAGYRDGATQRAFVAAAILVLFTLTVFWRVQNHGFVWDDGVNVERNPYFTSAALPDIARFWTAPYENLYIPVTYTVWGVIAHFAQLPDQGGEEVSLDPRLFHWANLFFHALSALIVFRILRRLVSSVYAAGAGALLFAWHPVQVEPVAWITGLKDVLSGFFALAAISEYLESVYLSTLAANSEVKSSSRNSGRKLFFWQVIHYSVGTIAFILALLAKPAAVVTPLIAGILAIGMWRRSTRQIVLSLGLWLALAMSVVIFTKLQQPDDLLDIQTRLFGRPFVAADALAFYLYKVFLPFYLGPGYARSPEIIFSEGWAFVSWLLPVSLAVVIWRVRRHWPWTVPAAGVFIAGLLPVLGLVQFQYQNWSTVADRYLYLSMLGPALAFANLIAQRWDNRKWLGVAGVILFCLGVKSVFQSQIWHNSETLWRYAVEIGQDSAVTRSNLGATLIFSKPAEAMIHLRRAVELAPDFADGHYNLARLLAERGDHAEAIEHYKYALKLRPTYPDLHYFLGLFLAKTGQLDEAIKHQRLALETRPRDAQFRNNLGNLLADRGLLDEAIVEYREAIRLKPNLVGGYFNLGIVYQDRGDLDEAKRQFLRVLQLDANHADAHNNLAVILAGQGKLEEAIDHFRVAIRIRPDFAEAQKGLAMVQLKLRKP